MKVKEEPKNTKQKVITMKTLKYKTGTKDRIKIINNKDRNLKSSL